jgi:UDP-glucose 4-epimerase
MRRALITGGAGFIGSHVADCLVRAGYEVEVLDDLSTGRRDNVPPRVPLHVLHVGSPAAAALVRDGRFTVLAHLAAQIDVRASITDPVRDATTNILGTLNLIEAIRHLPEGHRPRVVFASTGGALYGDEVETPTSESAATNPDAPYGIAKLATELYLAYYARIWNIEHAVLRFGNVYGPRQPPDGEAGVIAIFAKRLLTRAPLVVYGDGSQTRDYIYVEDVAEAFCAAATCELPAAGVVDARAFNVGTGAETSVLDLARMLASVAGIEARIEHAAKRPGELQRSVLDPSKARRLLGWRASVQLREGLARTVAWLESCSPSP